MPTAVARRRGQAVDAVASASTFQQCASLGRTELLGLAGRRCAALDLQHRPRWTCSTTLRVLRCCSFRSLPAAPVLCFVLVPSALRQAIAKAIIAYYQKYVDEQSKVQIKETLLQYDRTLLVADPRRCEPKK